MLERIKISKLRFLQNINTHKLLVTNFFFNTFNSLRDYDEREFSPEVKLCDVRRRLGVNFSGHVMAKTTTMQRVNAPSIFNIMPLNLAGL